MPAILRKERRLTLAIAALPPEAENVLWITATEKAAVRDRIARLPGEGVTVLQVEHDVRSVMELRARIAVTDFKRRIAAGTPRKIGRAPRVIEADLAIVGASMLRVDAVRVRRRAIRPAAFHSRQRDAALRLCRLRCRCKVRLMTKLLALWSGDLDLNEAFWTWTVTVGLLVNVATSILFLVLILQDQPLAALLVGYGLSVPYNLVAIVGVFRSAARYNGPSLHADLARLASIVLMAALTLT